LVLANLFYRSEAADIIRENDFGVVLNEVDEIKSYLEDCVDAKINGPNKNTRNKNRDNFTRERQFKKLEKFLIEIATK
jgi:hypothetical protein